MSKIDEIATEEQPQIETEPQPATEEETLLLNALTANTLTELQSNPAISEDLSILVTVYNALNAALGVEAPATVVAYQNLQEYKSKVQKVKKQPKEPKEKVFNEVRELRKAIKLIYGPNEGDITVSATDALTPLLNDPQITSELNVAITTYLTLYNLDLPEVVKDSAFNTLQHFGSKYKLIKGSSDRKPMQFQPPYQIEVNGTQYDTLSAALRGAGFSQDVLDEAGKPTEWVHAWTRVMAQIRKTGIGTQVLPATNEEFTFIRHWLDETEADNSVA
jgi:hypothetical protein